MGGTKKKATVPIKKESKYKIPSRFDCPLCDAKNSIAVRLVRSTGAATVHCRSCRTGAGKEYPFLPLEKPVDVFFRFREELMQQDREFLRENNIETDAVVVKTGLAQLLQKDTTTAAVAAREKVDGDVAFMRHIELGDENDDDDDDNRAQFFSPSIPDGYNEEEDFSY